MPYKLSYASDAITLRLNETPDSLDLTLPAIVPRFEIHLRLAGSSLLTPITLLLGAYALYKWLGPRPDPNFAILAAFGAPLFALIAFTLFRGAMRLKGSHGTSVSVHVEPHELSVTAVLS